MTERALFQPEEKPPVDRDAVVAKCVAGQITVGELPGLLGISFDEAVALVTAAKKGDVKSPKTTRHPNVD